MTPEEMQRPHEYQPRWDRLAIGNALEAQQRRLDHIADIIAGLILGLPLGMLIIWFLR